MKRTTGIPRSFLTTVDKSVALAKNGDEDSSKRPSSLMVNADGDFVIAKPDKAEWERYKAKVSSAATSKSNDSLGNKELQEKGLECPLDKKMFIEPMKTPCCGKTYCNDCITNALIESDFVCPSCQTEGVLIDDLKQDDDVSEKIKEYLQEKTRQIPNSPNARSPPPVVEEDKPDGVPPSDEASKVLEKTATTKSPTPPSQTPVKSPPSQNGATPSLTKIDTAAPKAEVAEVDENNSRKRPAEDILENPKIPKGPKAMQVQEQQRQQAAMNQPVMMNGMNNMNGFPGMPNMAMNMMPFGGMNMMGMPGMGMGNMANPMMMPMMPMNPMMGMPGIGMNGMNTMNGANMNGNFPNMNGNGMFNNYGDMSTGMNGMNPGMNTAGFGGNGGYQMRTFTQSGGEDDAYFRKPVNPHRHQNRQKRVRPSDYREL